MATRAEYDAMTLDQLEKENQRLGEMQDKLKAERTYIRSVMDRHIAERHRRIKAGLPPEEQVVVPGQVVEVKAT